MNLREEIFQHKKHARSIYGRYMQQSFAAVYAFDRFLGAHPDIDCLIELGTGTGGLSVHLACAMVIRDGTFYTFDQSTERCYGKAVLDALGWERKVQRVFGDIYSPATLMNIKRIIPSKRSTLIFCDGGNKPRELAMCSPLLGPGDFLMAHDWGTEVHERHIPAGWVPYQPWQEQADAMGTMQLFLKHA